jgi:hypothetical protein
MPKPLLLFAHGTDAGTQHPWMAGLDGADHSLQVAKRTLERCEESQEDVDDRVFAAVREFVTH